MRRACLVAVLAVLLAIPAQAQVLFLPRPSIERSKAGNYEDIHTVAVISGLKPVLTISGKPGFFGAKTRDIDIRSWQLDQLMVAATEKILKTRFEMKHVTYDAAALSRVGENDWWSGQNARPLLDRIPHQGVDAFVAIRSEYTGFSLGYIPTDARLVETANYFIDVIDARKWQRVATIPAQLVALGSTEPVIAVQLASRRLAFKEDLALSDEQMGILHESLLDLMATSLITTLRNAEMGLVLPGPNDRKLVATVPEDYPFLQINKIAVISTIGERFALDRYRLFGSRHEDVDIADWGLNAKVEDMVRKAVANRFEVKDIAPTARPRDAAIVDEKYQFHPNFPGLGPSDDVDAYLLLVKYPVDLLEQGPGLQHYTEGLGLENTGPIVGDSKEAGTAGTYLFAHYAVVLLDAHTLKPLAVRSAFAAQNDTRLRPHKVVDRSLFPQEPGPLPSRQIEQLQPALLELLRDSIQENLLLMGLTGMSIQHPSLSELAEP